MIRCRSGAVAGESTWPQAEYRLLLLLVLQAVAVALASVTVQTTTTVGGTACGSGLAQAISVAQAVATASADVRLYRLYCVAASCLGWIAAMFARAVPLGCTLSCWLSLPDLKPLPYSAPQLQALASAQCCPTASGTAQAAASAIEAKCATAIAQGEAAGCTLCN